MTSQPGGQAIAIHILSNIPISQEVKAIMQWNLVSWWNVVEKIFLDPFLKNQNWIDYIFGSIL